MAEMTSPETRGILQIKATSAQKENRKRLLELFQASPLPPEELIVNLGLYQRSSIIAKFLYINELYQLILDTPGVIMEFGVWWGQNLSFFESLRAVYEPYNFTRKVIGFDTFTGYPALTDKDGNTPLSVAGNYSVTRDYIEHLEALLEYHQGENPMPDIRKFELVPGNAVETLPAYLAAHPETIISLAYFDMQLYEPTKACLEAILPYLAKGSVLAMDELNSPEFPGETIAFREVLGLQRYRLIRSKFLPDRTYLVID